MPSIKIRKNSSLPAQDSFNRLKSLLKNDRELRRLDANYQCDFDDQSLSGQAKGEQFTASLIVSEDGENSMVDLVVDLPFHLALVKGMIEKTLQKKINEALG